MPRHLTGELARIVHRKHNQESTISKHLSPRELAFVGEYCVDFNARRAALAVGYKASSASKVSARWLSDERIAVAIRDTLQQRRKAKIASRDRVLEEMTRIALFDPRSVLDSGAVGGIKNPADLPEEVAAAISAIEFEEGVMRPDGTPIRAPRYRVKIWDKTKALELLAKYHNLLTDTVEHKGAVKVEVPDFSGETTGALKQRLKTMLAEMEGERPAS